METGSSRDHDSFDKGCPELLRKRRKPLIPAASERGALINTIDERKILMAWVILFLAGLFETGWAIGLKYTEGFTRLWPTVWTIVAMIISLWLLGIAVNTLPVGTAYSVWVGVGAVGTVVLGIVLLNEPAGAARLISVGLIIAGIIGLKLTTPT
jgi:quaternary ammonium compound-resistance protein SugE